MSSSANDRPELRFSSDVVAPELPVADAATVAALKDGTAAGGIVRGEREMDQTCPSSTLAHRPHSRVDWSS